MRRSVSVLLACVAGLTAAAAAGARADNSGSSSMMSSMPKNHMYLMGSWNCTVKLAAMGNEGPMTVPSTLTISMSPNMTLHSHVDSKGYMADTYQGYDAKTKTHWMTTSDVLSNAEYETSKDGVVFTGTEWGNAGTIPVRDTQTKLSDTKIRDLTEIKQNGAWTQLADAVCTKR